MRSIKKYFQKVYDFPAVSLSFYYSTSIREENITKDLKYKEKYNGKNGIQKSGCEKP